MKELAGWRETRKFFKNHPTTTSARKTPLYLRSLCLPVLFWGGDDTIAGVVRAEDINLSIIAQIESNNNPKAYNPPAKQGNVSNSEIALKDYNSYHKASRLRLEALFCPKQASKVAQWTLNKRIRKCISISY